MKGTRIVAKLHGSRRWANISRHYLGALVCCQVARSYMIRPKSGSYCAIIAKNKREFHSCRGREERRRTYLRLLPILRCEQTLLGHFFQPKVVPAGAETDEQGGYYKTR